MKLIEIYVQMNYNNINNPILYIALLGERDSIRFTNIPQESLLLSEISDNKSYPNPSIILKIQFFIL